MPDSLKTEHAWLNDLPCDSELWLQALVDNELTADQRQRYVGWLTEQDAWRDVAIAFLDEQDISRGVTAEVQASESTGSQPIGMQSNEDLDTHSGDRFQTQTAPATSIRTLLMSLLVGLCVGSLTTGFAMHSHNSSALAQQPEELNSVPAVNNAAHPASNTPDKTAVANNDRPKNDLAFRPASIRLPALFQIRETDTEAVFYADYSVPQFLLDALVIAGHKIELEQEFLGYTESLDDPAAVPLNVIRIHKYANLLAAN